jgi:glycyl-tRNA synthetase alpha chain
MLALSAKQQGPRAEREQVPVLAAYDLCLKCSHLFNILDARGAVSVTERVGIIGRIRNLTVGVAKAYAAQAPLAPPELAVQTAAASLEELAR